MNKLLLLIMLLTQVFSFAFAQSNKDYLNCKKYQNKEREIFLKNKVKAIIQIRTSYYDYEKKALVSTSDTSSIVKYDLLGNEVESEYWVNDTLFYRGEKLKYDTYGRLIYREFIPSADLKAFAYERHYFYPNKQSCVMNYALSYDPFQKGKLKDSTVYTYISDTLISTIYQLDNSDEWIYTKTERKIIDQKSGLIKKEIDFETTKEYQFSEDFKLLSIVSRTGIMNPTKLKLIYEGDLIIESYFFNLLENHESLQLTSKYYYEFY